MTRWFVTSSNGGKYWDSVMAVDDLMPGGWSPGQAWQIVEAEESGDALREANRFRVVADNGGWKLLPVPYGTRIGG
jgi:hypothetical protein